MPELVQADRRRSGRARARRRCGAEARRPPARARSRSRARPPSTASVERAPRSPRSTARTAMRASGRSVRPAGVSATPRGNRLKTGPVELFLERADVLGERRLGDADAAGCARERSLVHDRDEALQLAEVHRQNLSDRWLCAHLTYRTKDKKLDPVRVTGINHVSIAARDLEESTRFYVEVFGMEPIATPIFATPVQWLRCGTSSSISSSTTGDGARAPPHRADRRRLRRRLRRGRELDVERVGQRPRRAPLGAGAALLPRPGRQPDRAELAGRLDARPVASTRSSAGSSTSSRSRRSR